uniref:Peptidase C1A papain C-terminal domain-containing protein n=1 Tax=Meloidogyne incognita TaxID=6306 RepID=A0A914KUG1_MELIC
MGIEVTEEKLKLTAQRVVIINGLTNGIWEAKLGFFSLLPDEYQKKLSGVTDIEMETVTGIETIRNKRQTSNSTKKCNYTTEFDVRDKWPKCSPFLNHVQDQAFCGGCWAISTASAYTDRHCIERDKKGLSTLRTANTIFSSYELLSCTPKGSCRGGSPYKAWELIKSNGICTGSDYLGDGGCKPYPFGPKNTFPILKDCYNKCTNKTWGVPYDADRKNYVITSGTLKGEQAIKDELNKNGPVVAIFNVYKDFYHYADGEDGVYFYVSGDYDKPHAVVIVGYGTAYCEYEKTPYWIIRNSWGTSQNLTGFLKFKRGNNECGIDANLSFGIPKIN